VRAKSLRLVAFLLATAVAASLVAAHHVRAQVNDVMLNAGSHMMQLGTDAAPPRVLRLNGARLHVRAQFLRDVRLTQVLDVLEARCRARGAQLDASVEKLFRDPGELDRAQRALFDGVLRAETAELGALACLDTGGQPLSPSDLSRRVATFLRTLDLADIGHLRYMRAEQQAEGVQLLMTWSEGPMKLKEMFPPEGDAPGLELGDLPRPPSSRRVLSAWEEGAEPAINSYLVSGTQLAELAQFYDGQLSALGYEFLTPKPEQPSGRARSMHVAKAGRSAVIAMTQRGAEVLVTLAPDGIRGAATMRLSP
jgi:hypothetical protein